MKTFKEYTDLEEAKKVIASVELWNGKKMKKSFKNQSSAEKFIKKMQDQEDVRGYNMYAEGLEEGDGLWANIHKKRKSGRRMRKPGEKGAPTKADFKRARGENVEEGKGKPESFEAQFKRRVVKTTKPEHKEKGYNWRIKGKDRPEISIKLYKEKPGFAEFKKQLRRVAGHEFG